LPRRAQQGSAAGVIGLERFEMIRGQAFKVHAHETHQLAWASAGVLMVDPADQWRAHARLQAGI